jgi:hypothetical protein
MSQGGGERSAPETPVRVAGRHIAEFLEPTFGIATRGGGGIFKEDFVVLVLEQDVLQGVPVVVKTRRREIGFHGSDEFVLVGGDAFGVPDR